MITYETINKKLEKLKEYITYLKGYQKHTISEIKKDYTLQGAVLRYLQLSIECVIDIAEMLISELRLPKPEEAREIFEILARKEVITDDFAGHLAPMARLRNLLVHEYAKIDLNKIYSYLQNDLEDFEIYAKSISQFLESQHRS